MYALSSTKIPTVKRKIRKEKQLAKMKPIVDALKLLFDFSIFQHFTFSTYLVSSVTYIMGSNIGYLFIRKRAKIPQNYVDLLVPAIGISSIIIRITCGFVAFRFKRPYIPYLVGATALFSATVNILSAEYGHDVIWFQMFYCVAFSFGVSCQSSLRTIILVHLFGLSKLTNAFGLNALFMGVGVFIGTAIGGVLVDKTQNSDAAFLFCGWVFLVSGVAMCYIPYIVEESRIRTKK